MDYDFDPGKNALNIVKHGFPLTAADFFDWDTAVIRPDARYDDGEERMIALGYIGARLYCLVCVDRDGKRRIISLRKANKREEKIYASTQT